MCVVIRHILRATLTTCEQRRKFTAVDWLSVTFSRNEQATISLKNDQCNVPIQVNSNVHFSSNIYSRTYVIRQAPSIFHLLSAKCIETSRKCLLYDNIFVLTHTDECRSKHFFF